MSYRTPLMEEFERLPQREDRAAKHIKLWQNHGEAIYYASVEQTVAHGVSPEDAIGKAREAYLADVSDREWNRAHAKKVRRR